jgi:hypothetical protein
MGLDRRGSLCGAKELEVLILDIISIIGIGLAVWWVVDGVIRVYKGDIDGNTGKI